eukprot:s510_g11.t6
MILVKYAVHDEPLRALIANLPDVPLDGCETMYKADGLDSHATPDCATFNKWVSLVMKAYKTDSEVEDCHMIPQWCYASKVDKLVPMIGDLEQNVRKVDKRLAFLKLNSTNHHSHVLKKYDVGCGCLTPENLKAVQEHFIEDFVHLRTATLQKVLGTSKYAPKSASDPNFVVKDSKCTAFHRNGKQLFGRPEGLKLVSLRGQAMQDAAAVGKQAMLSVAGFEKPKLSGLCEDARKQEGGQAVCQIANELFPKGFSCAGTEKAINILKELAEKNGALQAKVLKTSGGFHTSLMEPAKQRLAKALDEMLPGMQPLKKTVYMNATAEPLMPGTAPQAVVDLLKKQLTSPVLWEPSMQKMLEAGLTDFYECGPNKQIKAMMKRINAKAWGSTTNADEPQAGHPDNSLRSRRPKEAMHGWEPNTWTGNVEAEPITVMHPGPWEVPEQEPSTLQSETIHLQQELARVRSDLFRSEQQLEALRVVPHAERQENVADRLLVSKVDCGAEGEGPRELIPIVLGFERLGELISHLHPQRLQEAAKAAKELPTLRPWPQGQGDLSHCEDPEGLVTKYVEQSLVWAAMIVSRCRSMFVLAHLKQKRMGAVNLYLSLSRARQHRMARTWQRWRRSACLMQRSAQKKQEQLQLWSQGVARTLRLKLLHAQMKHQLLNLFNCWQRQAAQGSRFSQCRSKDGSDNKQRIHGNDRVSRLLNIPASPWQSALSTHGHDSPDASHGQDHSWESWQSWRKAPRSSESSPRGQRSPPRQLRAPKPSLRNLFLLMADGLVASQLHAVLLQWHKGFATRKTAAVALKGVLHKCLEGRRRDALSRLRFGTIQRRPVRVSSDKGLQVFLPGRLSVDRSIQAMAVVRPSSEKSVQTLREKNISNNPWCQSWLTRILRRGQHRYLARAWCAWTREYVLRRLGTVLNSRLASRLQSVRWRTMHRYLSAWNTHCLRQHLLRVQQARHGKTQALVRAVCRLTVPGKVALRALLRAWQDSIAAKVEALRSIFRSWKLSSFRTRALLGARRFLERRGAEDACQHSYTLFTSWKSAARVNSDRRACAERSQQSWLASKEELTKLCRRALLERTWARWRHVAAEAFARFRSSRLLEMKGDLQLARQVLLSFQGWKILFFARRSHPARRPSRAMDSFGFVPLLMAIVSGWRKLVNRCRHRQLVASNVIRAVTATSSSLLLVSLCRWSRLAYQSRQRARASKCQDQLSSQLAALRRNRYLNAAWRGFAMIRGNRKARRAHVFMDPEAVAARRVLLHSATPSDVWLLHQVLQVFCLEVERSRSIKREIVFQMRGKKLAQLVAGAMLPKWEAASRCALLRHAFAVLRQAALQEQRHFAQASILQFRRELEEERGALRLRQQEDLASRARHRRNSLRPLVLCWRMAAAHRRHAAWVHFLMHKVHAAEQGGMVSMVTAIAFFVWRRSSMRLGPRCQRSIMILMNWRQRKAQSKLLTAWRREAARQRLVSGLCRDFEHTRKSRPTSSFMVHVEARTRALLEVIRSLAPSVCCFQEVVPQVARQLKEALPEWQCSDSSLDSATVQPYRVMAFVQPGISAEFELHPLPTAMSRSLLLVKVPGLTVGTVHLESLANPRMREEQLRQCAGILAPCSNAMLVGDFNFDSERNFKAPHEPLENDALSLLQDFTDLWPTLRPGEPGKTFDSRLNPYIGEYEQMRYDRVMVKLEAWTTEQIRLVGDEPLNHLVKLTPMEEDWLLRPPTPKRPQPGCRKSIDFELDATTLLGCLLVVRLWHRVVCEARGGLRMQTAMLERSATSQATQQVLAVLLQWARLVAESRKRARRRDLANCQLRLQCNGFLSFLVHAWARVVDREVLANWARACDRSLAAAASASEFYTHKRRTLLIAAIWSGWCFHVSEMRGRCKLLRISQSARNAEHVQLQMILWKHWTTSALQARRRREELRHRSQRIELQTASRWASLLSFGFWRWRLRAQRLGLVLRVQSMQAQAFVSLLSPTLCWRLWAELARQRRLSLAQGRLVKRSAARLVTQSIRAVVAGRLGQALAQCARHVGLRSQAARFSSRAEELARRHCQRRTMSAWRSAAERTARAHLCSRALDVSLQRFGSATVCPGHDRLVGRGCPAVFTARANEALLFHSWRLCARWAAWFDRAWQRSAEVRSDLLLESQQLQDELRRQHSRAERNAEDQGGEEHLLQLVPGKPGSGTAEAEPHRAHWSFVGRSTGVAAPEG